MHEDVWKQFDSNTLTHSAAHYLCAVNELLEEQGYARVIDVSRRLNITRGSCSISLKALKKRGLIVEDANKFLTLSHEGRRLAEVVALNAELLQSFFSEVLGVDHDQAEVDACKIEHLISVETSLRLYNFMNFVRRNHATAEPFLAAYRTFVKSTCKGQPRNCEVCKSVCMMDAEPVEPVRD
jgi:DtxR family transcriptional regulator, Mn-dependent transcriptional regulator